MHLTVWQHSINLSLVLLRSWHFRSFSGFGFFKFLSGFRVGFSVLIYYVKMNIIQLGMDGHNIILKVRIIDRKVTMGLVLCIKVKLETIQR